MFSEYLNKKNLCAIIITNMFFVSLNSDKTSIDDLFLPSFCINFIKVVNNAEPWKKKAIKRNIMDMQDKYSI